MTDYLWVGQVRYYAYMCQSMCECIYSIYVCVRLCTVRETNRGRRSIFSYLSSWDELRTALPKVVRR